MDVAAVKADAENAAILASEASRKVIAAFADKLDGSQGILDAERFKAIMNEVKAETGVKGKDLFHPVRIVLTGSHSGPEFDKLVPLIEEGAALGLAVLSVRARVRRWLE